MRTGRALRGAVVALTTSVVVAGSWVTAANPVMGKAAVRCPAPGEAIDDAVSTAPPRHTPEEQSAVRRAIETLLKPDGDPVASIGDGRDTVEVGLVPGREDVAARLVRRYGDAVRIHVGTVLYVPRGCG